MSDGFTKYWPKDGLPKHGMQVTLEGGPFHGELIQWPTSRDNYVRPMLDKPFGAWDSASDSLSAIAYTVPMRKVVYALDRWNEARTAGIAICVDDGKPKCKHLYNQTEVEYRKALSQSRAGLLTDVDVVERCGACGIVLDFRIRLKPEHRLDKRP